MLCLGKGGAEEEWTGRVTKQRPKGGSFLKQTVVLLCVFVCGKTCVYPDLSYTDVP